MSERDFVLMEIPVEGNDQADVVRVKVDYDKGGMNFLSGSQARRGIYYVALPLRIEQRDGYRNAIYTAWSGTRIMIKEMKRFVLKQFESHCDNPDWESVIRVVSDVCNKLTGRIEGKCLIGGKELDGVFGELVSRHGDDPRLEVQCKIVCQ